MQSNPNLEADKFAESSQPLQSLLATVSDMFLFLSPEGEILFTNPVVTEKLGYEAETLRGASLRVLLPQNEEEEWNQILSKIAEIKSGTFRLPFLTQGGELRQIEMDLSKVVWSECEMLFAICRDITHRVENEKSEHEQLVLAAALADFSTWLNSSLNIEDVLERILENVGKVIPNKSCNIMYVEDDQARIVRSRGYDVVGTEEILMSRVFDLKKYNYLYKMAYTLNPQVSEDTANDPNWTLIPESLWVRSYVAAPISFQGKLFGFLSCESDKPGFYQREHALKLKHFADLAGIAMENALLFTDTRRYAHQMTLLNDLTRTSLNSDDFKNVLEELPSQLAALFQAQNVYITSLDESTQKVVCIATTHPHHSNFIQQVTETGSCTLTIKCLEAGKAVLVRNGPEPHEESDIHCKKYPESSLLALPMNVKGQKIGAIIVGFSGSYAISEVDDAIGEYTANLIAPLFLKMASLDQERTLREQLSHTNELISVLSRVGTFIVSAPDTDSVSQSLGEELEKIGIHSMVLIKSSETDEQVIQYFSQKKTMQQALEHLLPTPPPVYHFTLEGLGLNTEVLQQGKPLFIEDPESIITQQLPEILKPFKRRFFSIVLVRKESKAVILPLTVESKNLGTLILWGEHLKQVDIEAFSLFGVQTSAAFQNAALMEKIKHTAITDELTGIFNRRGINELGQHEVEVAARLGRPLSTIMFDVDYFKIVNDTYGHPIGDQVLCEIVRRCKYSIRGIDLLGRYGGEEFLLILINTDITQAYAIAERLRKVVADLPIHTDASDLSVTISLGVAELSREMGSIDEMIKAADLALYTAKNHGRNIVGQHFNPETPDE